MSETTHYRRHRDGAIVLVKLAGLSHNVRGEIFVNARAEGRKQWNRWALSVFLQHHELLQGEVEPQPEEENWIARVMKGWAAPGTVFTEEQK